MTMDVEMNPRVAEENDSEPNIVADPTLAAIINRLVENPDIVFKSQQRGEADLSNQEKNKLAFEIFHKSKANFLTRYGKYLSMEHLKYFDQFTIDSDEIEIILRDLQHSMLSHSVDVKNRRYEALLRMIQEGSYFSDVEMMKRNPLLYEQLVGQYLTKEEKIIRDREKMYQQETFVRILMEGIERDNAEIKKQKQEEYEDEVMEEEEDTDEDMTSDRDSPVPCTSRWGEYHEDTKTEIARINRMNRQRRTNRQSAAAMTVEERKLLKEEFITSMYQSFLDGKDEDFDYNSVDNNEQYDNIDIVDHDEEEKYFDSEEPKNVVENGAEESSEDELDIYMSALNNHPAVMQLSNDIKKM